MRPQWARAWLLAPFGVPTFSDRSAVFTEAVFRDDANRVARLAVWFQAEKTQANPLMLARGTTRDDLSRREIIRIADTLAWPSDVASWRRFCNWIIANVNQCPVPVIPPIVAAFEVWQNLAADYPNAVSHRITVMVSEWLEDIEDRRHPEEFIYDHGRWEALSKAELTELESSLRSLLLRSARTEPKCVQDYLARVRSRRRLRREVFKEIVVWAPILSATHPRELVELTVSELKGDLPSEVAKRPAPHGVISRAFSHHDWGALAIRDSSAPFFPASPKREPFYSLFQNAPSEAQGLVRTLTNHAITAWQQLFSLDWQRRGTPLPITLEFPWGRQDFWGNHQVYVWSRGYWAPHAVETGLMALEYWAFTEIDRGHDVDDVIRKVVSGHHSCAVLSIAVMIALASQRVSATTLPLITSQHLLAF